MKRTLATCLSAIFFISFISLLAMSNIYESKFLDIAFGKTPLGYKGSLQREIKGRPILVDENDAQILDWMNIYLPITSLTSVALYVIVASIPQPKAKQPD